MIVKSKISTYFFIGKLSDSTATYNVLEEMLPNDFRLEVFLDSLYIWGTTDKPFDKLLPEIKEIIRTLTAFFIFQTDKPITCTLTNWVEAKDVNANKNMIGWFVPGQTVSTKPSKRNAKINKPWKLACWYLRNQKKGNKNHRLALKDYSFAKLDFGEDAFLFAYRALEDICRAVTGKDDTNDASWSDMHKKLKTNRQTIKPLQELSELVRHGKTTDKKVIKALKHKDKYLKIARNILYIEFRNTFNNFK